MADKKRFAVSALDFDRYSEAFLEELLVNKDTGGMAIRSRIKNGAIIPFDKLNQSKDYLSTFEANIQLHQRAAGDIYEALFAEDNGQPFAVIENISILAPDKLSITGNGFILGIDGIWGKIENGIVKDDPNISASLELTFKSIEAPGDPETETDTVSLVFKKGHTSFIYVQNESPNTNYNYSIQDIKIVDMEPDEVVIINRILYCGLREEILRCSTKPL